MRLGEELGRGLTEVRDLGTQRCPIHRRRTLAAAATRELGRVVQRDRALVREVVEDVVGGEGGGATLLVAEDQVDPLVDIRRDMLRLQRSTVQRDEGLRAASRLRSQPRTIDTRSVRRISCVLRVQQARGWRR